MSVLVAFPSASFLVPMPFPVVAAFEMAGTYTKNGCGLTPLTLRIDGMRYYETCALIAQIW